jgi:plasmid stabilization system protein ParE
VLRSPSPSSSGTGPFEVLQSRRARRDREEADDWWLATHGAAPSRLERELADAFAALATNPYLGFASPQGRRQLRKLRLGCDFIVVHEVRPRLRRVVIIRILAASRLHGVVGP